MRLGLIARADNTGLGVQTHEFYKHMNPHKTMVVDISVYNKNKQYPERYQGDNVRFQYGFPDGAQIVDFLRDLDVVFIAEASYNPSFYAIAKDMGVKVAVQYNYEFFDWFGKPKIDMPDMFIAPSMWHYEDVDALCKENGIKHVYLHCPVNKAELKPSESKLARTFLHTAGRSAAHDRNGTESLIVASKFLETDAKITIHFQGEQGLAHQATSCIDDYRRWLDSSGDPSKVEIRVNEYDNYADVYSQGDVFVLPRRYGGNCLPLNEALGCGMPAIMTDISPNNELLPKRWLVESRLIDVFEPRTKVEIYDADTIKLARLIDSFYNMDEETFSYEKATASAFGMILSWDTLKFRYMDELEALCNQ